MAFTRPDKITHVDSKAHDQRAICAEMRAKIGGRTAKERRERAYQAWCDADAAGDREMATKINVYRASMG